MEEFTRFIDGFRAVVLVHTESEMRELWKLFKGDSKFPTEAVTFVRIEYYESSKAQKIMECYVSDCNNLHQTSTSHNESAHAAIRSKASILQSPVESYRLRRQYNDSWICRLRAKAATAKNRVPLDLQNMLELRNLLGKVSEFALTEIKRQILLARRKYRDMDMRWKTNVHVTYFGATDFHAYILFPSMVHQFLWQTSLLSGISRISINVRISQ